MKLSPQKQYIYNLLKSGSWVCSNQIDPTVVRDYRKRISEMNHEGFTISSQVCDCGIGHKAKVHKYRLDESPVRAVYEFDLVNVGGIRVRKPRLTYVPAEYH